MKLFDHQTKAVKFLLKMRNSCIFFDMGAGKTLIVLTWLWLKRKQIGKTLVVAPLWVVKNTWPAEIKKWGFKLSCSYILGNKKQRLKAAEAEADIYFINHDNLIWLINNTEWDYNTLIIDELSLFSSHTAIKFRGDKRNKKKGLIDVNYKYFIGMTGTPKNYMSLYSQIFLADRGHRLGKNITKFRNTYCYKQKNDWGFDFYLKPGSDHKIESAIKDICISLPDCDFKPKVILNDVYTHIDEKVYNRFKRTYVYKAGISGNITAANAGVLSGKLRQLANGRMYNESRQVINCHDEKLDALENIILQNGDNPVLVFISYKHDMSAILNRFMVLGAKTIESNESIEDWNAGKIPILVVHPASCGHGINLQAGGHVIVWYGLTWNLEHYLQANARLVRTGQKRVVTINRIVAKGTIDEAMIKAIHEKKVTQDSIIEAVKLCL